MPSQDDRDKATTLAPTQRSFYPSSHVDEIFSRRVFLAQLRPGSAFTGTSKFIDAESVRGFAL